MCSLNLKEGLSELRSVIESKGLTIYDKVLKLNFIDGSTGYLVFSQANYEKVNINHNVLINWSDDFRKYMLGNDTVYKNVPVNELSVLTDVVKSCNVLYLK